jgi:hypothetical protein
MGQFDTAEGNRKAADLADHRAAEALERGDSGGAYAATARDIADLIERKA